MSSISISSRSRIRLGFQEIAIAETLLHANWPYIKSSYACFVSLTHQSQLCKPVWLLHALCKLCSRLHLEANLSVWACLSMFERVWACLSIHIIHLQLNRIESDWIGLNRAWNMQLSWSLDTLNMMTWFNPRCQSHLNPLPVNLVGIVVLHARLSGLMWFDVVWCGLMWFDVVWCGLMWFVMQSRHIQNQPKKKHPFWWAGGPQRRSYLWRSRNQSLAT